MRLITMLYDINGGSLGWSRYLELLRELSRLATAAQLPLTVFCEPDKQSQIEMGDIDVVGWPLHQVPSYQAILQRQPNLPTTTVNSAKDTLEFLALMNSKLDFVLRAAELYPDQHFAYIDAGIAKVLSNSQKAVVQLAKLSAFKSPTIRIAGIWPALDRDVWNQVYWRFCGGFFVGDRKVLQEFRESCDTVMRELLSHNCSTWEVNVWALAERRGAQVEWYSADHNDSILNWD